MRTDEGPHEAVRVRLGPLVHRACRWFGSRRPRASDAITPTPSQHLDAIKAGGCSLIQDMQSIVHDLLVSVIVAAGARFRSLVKGALAPVTPPDARLSTKRECRAVDLALIDVDGAFALAVASASVAVGDRGSDKSAGILAVSESRRGVDARHGPQTC